MKKVLALILALVMVLSLAACGAKTEAPAPAPAETPAETPAEAPVEEVPAEEPLTWPGDGDVNVLIPANPGGGTDTTFRTISTNIMETIGSNVMLTNMNGGAGAVATQELLDYEPDGYTAIWHHYDSILLTMKGEMDQRYDEYLDFAAVVATSGGGDFVTVNKSKGWTSLEELIAYGKEHPGELIWAVESGGWSHVAAVATMSMLGVEFNVVDFGSRSERSAALLGGHADVLMASTSDLNSYPDDFVGLAHAGLERSQTFTDIPTMAELGYGGSEADTYYFLGFRKGTDPRIVAQMGEAVKKAMETPEAQELFINSLGYTGVTVLLGEEALEYIQNFETTFQPFVDSVLKVG